MQCKPDPIKHNTTNIPHKLTWTPTHFDLNLISLPQKTSMGPDYAQGSKPYRFTEYSTPKFNISPDKWWVDQYFQYFPIVEITCQGLC